MKEEKTYTDSFKEYQDKMYLPGYYVGGNIHPSLQAKTKTGGFVLVSIGTIYLMFILFQIVNSSSTENVGLIISIVFSILAIVVGIKFIIFNKQK